MNSFDDRLRSALRRREPPADFAQRVRARIEPGPAQKPGWLRPLRALFASTRFRRFAVSAAACTLLLIGVVQYRRYQRLKTEAESAKERLLVALRIAGTKLNVALEEAQQVERLTPDRKKAKSTRRTEQL